MIKSFDSEETELLFHRQRSKRISLSLCKSVLRKLYMIDAAVNINDLRMPPGNHLEKLKGNMEGQHSIRIKKLLPPHPGEILLEEFIKPLGITQYRLAKDIHVPPRRINEIIHKKRGISADTALRFARYFGTSAQFWLNLQSQYDLEIEQDELGDSLQIEVKIFPITHLKAEAR